MIGVLFVFTYIEFVPTAHAAVPTPAVSLTATPAKFNSPTWINDGSLPYNETLSATSATLPAYSSVETAVVFNSTASLGQYIAGYVGSTSSVTNVTFQITMYLQSTQLNSPYGMILGWSGSNYSVWTQGNNCLGFNTGTSEIYGFNVNSYLDEWHTYTFIMSTTQDNTTKQKAYVDGSLKSLSLCAGSSVTQSRKTWGNANTFFIGKYGTGDFFTNFKLRAFKLWLSDIGNSAIVESYNSTLQPTSHTIALTSGLNSAVYRTNSTIRSNTDIDGKVTFFFNGKRIPGCINLQTVSKQVDCIWKPSAMNFNTITAQLVAPGGSLTSTSLQIFVSKRANTR